ncbi:MAG: acyl-CoA dehydrogenase [Alphaproteobacteria bacterium]|nr:acyl-CoA dehydrogenase [Alphaproteobacteria bacterium]
MADRSFLDWPFLDETHRALAGDLHAWLASATDIDNGEAADIDAATRDLVTRLGAAGFLRYAVPRAYGGVAEGLDARSLCLIREMLAYVDGLADFAFAMQGLGSASISLFGSENLKERYLPPVAAGAAIAAFALSEKAAGSDVAALATTATPKGNGFVLDGEKTWISNGGIADHYVVFARTGEAPGAKGLSAFIVDADTPGLSIAERIEVIAPHPLATLKFEDCRIDADCLIGEAGQGFKVAMATLDMFRSTVAAAGLGFARRALDEALARVQSREVFGQRLADFQITQQKIADMAVKIDAAALLVYRAAWTKDRFQGRVTREASMAKLYATESAQEVIDQAVQIFGGDGVVRGTKVEQLYRDIRALRIYEGTSEIQQLVIAARTLAAAEGG